MFYITLMKVHIHISEGGRVGKNKRDAEAYDKAQS
jgi:hypothetical protein